MSWLKMYEQLISFLEKCAPASELQSAWKGKVSFNFQDIHGSERSQWLVSDLPSQETS